MRPDEVAEILADAGNHHNYMEGCYTLDEHTAALYECIEYQEHTPIRPCQCKAHLVLADRASFIRPYVLKILDIAMSRASPSVENQVSDFIINFLEIMTLTTAITFIHGNRNIGSEVLLGVVQCFRTCSNHCTTQGPRTVGEFHMSWGGPTLLNFLEPHTTQEMRSVGVSLGWYSHSTTIHY